MVKPYHILNKRFGTFLPLKAKMCTVKQYRILSERFRTFCRKASLPFPGEWTWDCGITFDIFTHDIHGSCKIYYNIYT